MVRRRPVTSRIKETNLRISRKLAVIEQEVRNQLGRYYDNKLRDYAGVIPTDILRSKHSPRVQAIIRKQVAKAYDYGAAEIENKILEKDPEFVSFPSVTDAQNIANISRILEDRFWRETNKLLQRRAGFDTKTVNKQRIEKKALDEAAPWAAMGVNVAYSAFNLAIRSKLPAALKGVPPTKAGLAAQGELDLLAEEFAGINLGEGNLLFPGEGEIMFLTAEDANVDPVICEPLNRTVYNPLIDADIPDPPLHEHCRCRLVPLLSEGGEFGEELGII